MSTVAQAIFRIDLAARISTALTMVDVSSSIDEHCCNSCSHGAMDAQLPAGTPYVVVNEQSWENAEPGGTLWLSHGIAGGAGAFHVAKAARRATDALVKAGLNATWNDSVHQRIKLNL